VRVASIHYSSGHDAVGFNPYPMGPLELTLRLSSDSARPLGSLAIILYDRSGTKLVNADTLSLGQAISLRPGHNTVRLRISALYLNPGEYVLGWWLANPPGKVYDFAESALTLEVVDIEANRLGTRPRSDGVVACQFELLEAV
jgi:hypothetical protein